MLAIRVLPSHYLCHAAAHAKIQVVQIEVVQIQVVHIEVVGIPVVEVVVQVVE